MNMTQELFAQLLDVHSMTVSKWERGILTPSPYRMSLMSEFKKAAKKKRVKDGVVNTLIAKGSINTLYYLLKESRDN